MRSKQARRARRKCAGRALAAWRSAHKDIPGRPVLEEVSVWGWWQHLGTCQIAAGFRQHAEAMVARAAR